MSSVICDAGSVSDYEIILRDSLPPSVESAPGVNQISRFLAEPWDFRSLSCSESRAYWPTQKSFHQYPSPQLLARTNTAPEAFQDTVSAIPILRSATHSSTDSDESRCSIPESHKLAKASWSNHIGLFEEPESDSDEENVFESLNTAIINVLAPDLRLAAGVITHLYKLPAHLRAFVYGFARHNGDEDYSPELGYVVGAGPSISNSTQVLDGQFLSKRKRRSVSDDLSTEDVVERRKSRIKSYTKSIVDKLKYACPFNIYNSKKYCVRNERGGTGCHYQSCMGPGFTDPRRLKEHFGSTHRIHQCQRCWQIFDTPEELSYHRDKEVPRCEDRTHLIHEKEGITDIEWERVQRALAVPRARKGKEVPRKTDPDRWFEVWKILFPPEKYPELPFPSHPYYADPQMLNNPLPTYSETERRIEIVKAIWDKKVEDAPDGQYQPSQEDVFKMIRQADSVTNRSAHLPEHLTHPLSTAHAKPVSFKTVYTNEKDHLGNLDLLARYDHTGEGLQGNDKLGPSGLEPAAPTGAFVPDPYATNTNNDGYIWPPIDDENNPELDSFFLES